MSELATKQEANTYTESYLTPLNEYVTKQEFQDGGGTLQNSSSYSSNEMIQITDMTSSVQDIYTWSMNLDTQRVPQYNNLITVTGNIAGQATSGSNQYTLNSAGNYTQESTYINYINYSYNNKIYKCTMGNSLNGILTFSMKWEGKDVVLASLNMNQFVNGKTISLGTSTDRFCIENNLSTGASGFTIPSLFIFDSSSPPPQGSTTGLSDTDSVISKWSSLGYSRGKHYAYDGPYAYVIRNTSSSNPTTEYTRINTEETLWPYYLYYNKDTDSYQWVEAYEYTIESDMDRSKYYGDLATYSSNIHSDVYGTMENPEIRCRPAAEYIYE